MKRLFFVFALIFGLNSMAFSQNWFAGAGANFLFSTDSNYYETGGNFIEYETEMRTFEISPEIGYKMNKFDFGIYPVFQYNYIDYKQGSSSSTQSNLGFGMGLFSRFNFVTFFERLSFLGRMDVDYLFSKNEWKTSSQNENITHGISLSISPVIEFKLSDTFSLYSSPVGNIASIGYEYHSRNTKNGGEHSGGGHNFTFSFPSVYSLSLTSVSLGFYVTF